MHAHFLPFPPSHGQMPNWICYIGRTIGRQICLSHLFVEQVEGQLESNRLHVGPLQRRRDVHVHVEEPGTGVEVEVEVEVDGLGCEIFFSLSTNLLIAPPCSACSISSCERSLTNHSKLFWSRLIQKKSTCARSRIKVRIIVVFTLFTFLRLNMVEEMSSLHWYSHFGHFFFTCQYLHTKV